MLSQYLLNAEWMKIPRNKGPLVWMFLFPLYLSIIPFFFKKEIYFKDISTFKAESLIKVIADRNVSNSLSSRAGNNMLEVVRKFINTIILLYALIL